MYRIPCCSTVCAALVLACGSNELRGPIRPFNRVFTLQEVPIRPKFLGCSDHNPLGFTGRVDFILGKEGEADLEGAKVMIDRDRMRRTVVATRVDHERHVALQWLASCLWEPARISLQPVRVKMEMRLGFWR